MIVEKFSAKKDVKCERYSDGKLAPGGQGEAGLGYVRDEVSVDSTITNMGEVRWRAEVGLSTC